MSSAQNVSQLSIMPKTVADYENPVPGCSSSSSPLSKPDDTKFSIYQYFGSLTLGLTIVKNIISAFVHYRDHIQNRRIAWWNYLANTHAYASTSMFILTGRCGNLPCTVPVKDCLSDIIYHSHKL
jgi:hypothetical protein